MSLHKGRGSQLSLAFKLDWKSTLVFLISNSMVVYGARNREVTDNHAERQRDSALWGSPVGRALWDSGRAP